jgi:hypothetical protein
MKMKSYSEVTKKRQILFISQDTIGEYLSKFATELKKVNNLDYEIIYKLHPRECDGWADRYPWLKSSGIKVIDKRGVILHELLAKSMILVGVYSTALYEGLAYGLQTFIIDAPGAEYFRPLVKTGFVKLVKSTEELVGEIMNESQATTFDAEYFFKSNAVSNISAFLNRLVQ